MTCYRRDGTRVSYWEMGPLFNDKAYRRVAETTLPDGKWVSTVWMGIDLSMGGTPLIFETMVFEHQNEDSLGAEVDCDRYATEAEAVEGHARMVAKWMAGVPAHE